MKIAIIGAGVAGCTIGAELHKNGYEVHIVDQSAGPARATSGHHAALAHPHLTRFPTPLQQLTKLLNRQAFEQFASQRLHVGAHQIMTDENWVSHNAMEQRLKRLGLTSEDAQILDEQRGLQVSGLSRKGVWYPQAGVYDLIQICNDSLKNFSNEQLHWNTKIKAIEFNNETWALRDEQDKSYLEVDALVLANNLAVSELLRSVGLELELRSVRGQLSRFSISEKSSWIEHLPKIPLTGGGYSTPAIKMTNEYSIQVGSSYDEDNWQLEHWDASDEHNKQQLKALIGHDELNEDEIRVHPSFVGLRSAARDRMPVIGGLSGVPGLFVASAYGARGVLWSTLAPRLISKYVEAYFEEAAFLRAGFLTGATLEEEASFVSALSPDRFLAGAFTGRGSNSKATLPSG
jgi:tRNA 5-methylaminomethyl-2-thiouridine biosynthesis bifunctional protein